MPWRDWIRTVEVEPSLYAADLSRLGEQCETLLRAGTRILHFDVGDGHFVPPITMGPIVLQSIAPLAHRLGGVLDCHLMIEEPQRHFEAIGEAGGDSVTVHYEACPDLPAVARAAREQGLEVGLAFKPETSPEDAAAAAEPFDLVLCMSIEPGYSGQPFMPEALPRIRRLRELLGPDVPIQVDGGIGEENVRAVHEAGATLVVAGTAIFGHDDLPWAYRRLVQRLA
jgi:ribulose-phosphate 3-epimerase